MVSRWVVPIRNDQKACPKTGNVRKAFPSNKFNISAYIMELLHAMTNNLLHIVCMKCMMN